MASRLMLSLKKASVQPKIPWSLDTMTSVSPRRSAGGEVIIFASRMTRGSHGIPRSLAAPNEEDMVLGGVPRLPLNHDPNYGR
jgi:hypothetical protein